MRRTVVAIGILLLVGAPALWAFSQPAATVGELPPELATPRPAPESGAGRASAAPTDPLAEPARPTPATPPSPPTASAPSSSAQAESAESTRSSPPVAISIPAIGVERAEVVDVGLDDRGAVDIPDDVMQVGWYRGGPRPGEPGNAFFTSHVDSRTQGPGVLFDLRRTEPGDVVEVEHADGTVTRWEVVQRERVDKGAYPLERVFRFDGRPGLVIDTCGGRFDAASGSYESIDIVTAVLLNDAGTT